MSSSSVTTVAPSAQRRIRFDVVTVRSFERVLGDNPAVSAGVPLTLGARAVLKHLRHADEPLVSAIQPVPQWLGGDRRLVSLSFGILFALMPPLLLSIVLSFCPSVSR